MTINKPFISIITVCFNSVKTIEQTILSVINQTYSNFEYIIIDGGSTDGTVEIIKEYINKTAYFISEKDEGIYDAMNKGIRNAEGDWVFFINCGDHFYNNTVLADIFENKYDADIIYGDAVEINKKGERHLKSFHVSNKKNTPPFYRHGASFVRLSTHLDFLFDLNKSELFSYGLDYDCICRMFRANKIFQRVDIIVIDYLREGISNNPLKNIWLSKFIENEGKKDMKLMLSVCISILMAILKKIF